MVDNIAIVLPDELDLLAIDPEQDYCTFVTCTPYGINTHRLLVRGVRTENVEMESIIRVAADATQIDPIIVAPALAIPLLLILLIWMLIVTGQKNRKAKKNIKE